MLKQGPWPGWPSGENKPIMDITLLPKDLSERFGISFIREKDQLGWFEASHFIDEEIGPVVLMCYDYSPSGGTNVLVDSIVDGSTAIERVKKALELEPSQVIVAVA